MNIEITDEIRNLVSSIASVYRENLEHSKATGNLQNFETYIDINETRLSVSFELEDYWRYVEYGRGPGKMPPIDAIESWVKVKPIVPNPINNKIPSTKQLAYLIARKIGREGTPAQRPLEKTLYSDEVESLITAIKQEIISQVKTYIASDEIVD